MEKGKVYKNEDLLQADCFQHAWNNHPETRRCMWHVPNGKKRTIIDAVILKAMGVLAGVHDLHFYWQSQYYIFELKVGVNQLTDSQEKYRDAMTSQGAIFYEIRDLETFKEILTTILTTPPRTRFQKIKWWFAMRFNWKEILNEK
jgi:hypothetical protein